MQIHSMEVSGPKGEHLRLCLQLILQSHLHQFDSGLTEDKIEALCRDAGMQNVPTTQAARLEALQVLAAQLLPLFD